MKYLLIIPATLLVVGFAMLSVQETQDRYVKIMTRIQSR